MNYTVAVQIPRQYQGSLASLAAMPVTPPSAANLLQSTLQPAPSDTPQAPAQTLANLASISHRTGAENITHYTVQRVLDVEASIEGRDLGSVVRDINKQIKALGKLPADLLARYNLELARGVGEARRRLPDPRSPPRRRGIAR